jgi:serine O-acetyltransferase
MRRLCAPCDQRGALTTNTHTPSRPAARREEAERDAAAEPILSSFLYASILAHDSFERALAFVLANRLASAVMLPTQLIEIFYGALKGDDGVREGALADLQACWERVRSWGFRKPSSGCFGLV